MAAADELNHGFCKVGYVDAGFFESQVQIIFLAGCKIGYGAVFKRNCLWPLAGEEGEL